MQELMELEVSWVRLALGLVPAESEKKVRALLVLAVLRQIGLTQQRVQVMGVWQAERTLEAPSEQVAWWSVLRVEQKKAVGWKFYWVVCLGSLEKERESLIQNFEACRP